tara:strand:- start:759 stop:1052 length:294 start_codon:yes stop_codon:yes gene_type:complete
MEYLTLLGVLGWFLISLIAILAMRSYRLSKRIYLLEGLVAALQENELSQHTRCRVSNLVAQMVVPGQGTPNGSSFWKAEPVYIWTRDSDKNLELVDY